MSYNLIQVSPAIFNKKTKQSVNARELHSFLGVSTKFSDWIKNELSEFIENKEFISFSENLENGGRRIEYKLTIETAKQICMLSKTIKGRDARLYFIKIEEEFQIQSVKPKELSRKELAQMIIQIEEEKEALQIENEKLQTVVKIKDILHNVESNNLFGLQETGKKLHLKPNKFIEKLKEYGYLRSNNQPYQKYIDCGYFELKTNINEYVRNGETLSKVFSQTYITVKGLHYFENKIFTFFQDILVA